MEHLITLRTAVDEADKEYDAVRAVEARTIAERVMRDLEVQAALAKYVKAKLAYERALDEQNALQAAE